MDFQLRAVLKYISAETREQRQQESSRRGGMVERKEHTTSIDVSRQCNVI